jgi:UDPglucose 6-dehydrogenase
MALAGADVLLIVTEWRDFRSPDFDVIRQALKQPVVFNGRNLFAPEWPEAAGIEYHAIGRATAASRALRTARGLKRRCWRTR